MLLNYAIGLRGFQLLPHSYQLSNFSPIVLIPQTVSLSSLSQIMYQLIGNSYKDTAILSSRHPNMHSRTPRHCFRHCSSRTKTQQWTSVAGWMQWSTASGMTASSSSFQGAESSFTLQQGSCKQKSLLHRKIWW